MEKKNEVVFLAALGATGSSAVVDLLKEVRSYFVFESEFRLFVDPGGLINLRDALVENWSIFQTDLAIKNFLQIVKSLNRRNYGPYSTLGHQKYFDNEFIKQSKKYIEELTELKYRGLWYGIDNLIMRQLNKYRLFHRKHFLMKPIYVGKKLCNYEFNKITEDYIRLLINYCLKKYNRKNFCFNENFSCLFPFKILDMVPNSKIIVIVRDPKDVLADTKRIKWIAAPIHIDQFVKWGLAIYNRWMIIEDEVKKRGLYNKTILVIRFEDLILNYNDIIKKLFIFLKINESDHVQKKHYLNPDISVRNIGQWKNNLTEYEIKTINDRFKEFLNRYGYHKLNIL